MASAWRETKVVGGNVADHPVAFSADSKYVVCCSSGISVYSCETGQFMWSLQGHQDVVTGVIADQANPSQVFSCSLDGTIRLWDFMKAIELKALVVKKNFMVHKIVSQGQDIFAFCSPHPTFEHKGTGVAKKLRLPRLVRVSFNAETPTVTTLHKGYADDFCVTPEGDYLIWINLRDLCLRNLTTKEVSHVYSSTQWTALALDPSGECLLLGDKRGQIGCWYDWKSHKKQPKCPVRKILSIQWLHWHWTRVRCLTFHPDGSCFLSGGSEATLVIWQMNSYSKSFCPRLGGTILGIAVSPDCSRYAVCLGDNSVKLLRSYSYETEHTLFTVKRVSRCARLFTGLVLEPNTSRLVFNAHHGRVQWFDTLLGRTVSELEVTPPAANPLPELGTPKTRVDLVCFTYDAQWLATIEYCAAWNVTEVEIALNFWSYDIPTRKFVLNSRVDNPHKSRINALVAHPSKHTVVTASADTRFKVWNVVEHVSPRDILPDARVVEPHKILSWCCATTCFYKDLPATAAAFSGDGSVLAVACAEIVTLWDPSNATLLLTLSHHKEDIIGLCFVTGAPYMVVFTKNTVLVWNLLTKTVWWSYHVRIAAFACDPQAPRFAVATSYQQLQSARDIAAVSLSQSLYNRDQTRAYAALDVRDAHGVGTEFGGSILVFDAASQRPVTVLRLQHSPAALAFVPSLTSATSRLVYVNVWNEVVTVEEGAATSTPTSEEDRERALAAEATGRASTRVLDRAFVEVRSRPTQALPGAHLATANRLGLEELLAGMSTHAVPSARSLAVTVLGRALQRAADAPVAVTVAAAAPEELATEDTTHDDVEHRDTAMVGDDAGGRAELAARDLAELTGFFRKAFAC
eukprot:TRINITY_DN6910_c0_g1_i1.p1 TRINITY_DN6910_c0_g1~~TRINITY_DN6910_c0_g1_i1.p1  ORF type:complete len:873 (-),score=184.10 TRINITY_DN6910_c0_g1_i1:58-2631(-)